MASHLRNCAQLDRQIREEAKQRSIFDPELRRLRSSLRSECEAALLANFRLSQKHDVEQLLWKAVFYRPIEEFRRRIKQAEGELRAKTKLAFHAFLEDGKAFYLILVLKLQQRFGPAGLPPALAAQHLQQMGLAEPAPLPPSSRPLDCRASVHRCLVCLGDLSRYQVNAQPAAERCWAECRQFYLLAARVLPGGGSAYNQLAVLCSYEADDLGAAFYYFRALAAASPFAVARENLVAHFEQNKAASQRLAAATAGAGAGARGARPASQALRELRIRFTRLLGMLFTRDALDAFPGLLAAAMADLEDHLQRVRQQSRQVALAAAAEQQPPLLVQLAACAAYAAAHARAAAAGGAGGPPAAAPSFAAAAQQQLVGTLSLLLLFGLAERLAGAAVAAAAGAKQGLLGTASGVLLLPPLRLLLRWLAAAGPEEVLPPAGLQPRDAAELAAAQRKLWQAAAQLMPVLKETAQQGVEAAVPAGAMLALDAAAPALAEDQQLAGFLPLQEEASTGSDGGVDVQALGGGDPAAGFDYGDAATAAVRVRCMLADAARIAAVLDRAVGSGGGSRVKGQPGLGQAVRAFVAAAAPAGGLQHEEQPEEEELVMPAQQEQAQQAQQAQRAQQHTAPQAMPLPIPLPSQRAGRPAGVPADAPATAMEEDDEEEVILYAPQARATPSPPPAAAARMQHPQQVTPGGHPPPASAPQQQEQPGRGRQLDTDALMAETAQAVAGSVLPEEDRGASPPLAGFAGLQAPAQPAISGHPLAPAVEPPGQQPAPAAPGPPQEQQAALPWPLRLAAAPRSAAPAAPPLPQAQQPHSAAPAPSVFEALFSGSAPGQADLPQQQTAPALPYMRQPAGAAAGAQPVAAHWQQPQPAVGLRSLLFDGVNQGAAGLLGVEGQAQQPVLAPQAQPAVSHAGPAAPAVPAAPNALLSGGSAADRWAWMGAFGGNPAAAPVGLAPQPLPGAAHAPPAASQAALAGRPHASREDELFGR
ncbi:hypothetical protein ABPG77_009735 [Micractinium sp. CCAP 211/92]